MEMIEGCVIPYVDSRKRFILTTDLATQAEKLGVMIGQIVKRAFPTNDVHVLGVPTDDDPHPDLFELIDKCDSGRIVLVFNSYSRTSRGEMVDFINDGLEHPTKEIVCLVMSFMMPRGVNWNTGNSLTVAFLIFGNLAYTPNDYAQQFARLRRQFGIIVTTWVAFSLKLINASVSLVKAMECLGRQNGRSASLELDPIDVQWESSSTEPMD